MRLIGGRDRIEHIKNCLALIFTNDLATKCSLEGRKGNFKLKNFHVLNILIGKLKKKYLFKNPRFLLILLDFIT